MGTVKLRLGALTAVAFVIGGLFAATAANAAAPPLLTQFPQDGNSGSGADQLAVPLGIGISPLAGEVSVSEAANGRVSQFIAGGEFLRAVGWDVAPDSASGDTPGDQLEICSDVCQAGVAGSGAGQFNAPTGVAVDQSGAIYVRDTANLRIQKLSATGEFLLMFGGEVNKTTGANVCTKADVEDGDVCGAGIVGSDPGEFSDWVSLISSKGGAGFNSIAVDASGVVLVGDDVEIQKFNPDGTYNSQIPLPELSEEKAAQAVAVDPVSGDLYVSLSQQNPEFSEIVYRLNETTGAVLDELEVGDPDGTPELPFPMHGHAETLSVNDNGTVYAGVRQEQTSVPTRVEVVAFDSSGVCLVEMCPGDEFAKSDKSGLFGTHLTSVATVGNCLLASYSGDGKSFVRIYGKAECSGPPSDPQIKDQYAVSVGDDGAAVRAEINPRSQPDTTYYVEYGTAACSLGGCKARPAPPGKLLTTEVVGLPVTTSSVFLPNLQPGTTYHYRFVAESSAGGPVKGVGGTETEDGTEATFTTFPAPLGTQSSCPNQIFRTGLSAFLPSCRAYELVSPVDKENGDIIPLRSIVSGPAALAQSSTDGSKLSYSAYRAFGKPESAPWTSQYIAQRGASGWSNEAISPPREGAAIPNQQRALDVQYNVFSPDLCTGWFMQDAEPTLDSDAPPGVSNLYRRQNCGDVGYGALVRANLQVTQARDFWPELQGVSANGNCAVFRANGKLTSEASDALFSGVGVYQVYETCGKDMRLVSILPDGNASDLHSSAGTASGARPVHRDHSVLHALSADGSRVYWTAAAGFGWAPGVIYVRDNADQDPSALVAGKCLDTDKACTYPVTGTVSGGNGTFMAATPSGSSALFTIGEDLYRFEFAGESSTSSLIAGQVKGLLGSSEDLTRIYLASEEVRAPGAAAGKPNLYLYENGSFTFIATLTDADVWQRNQLRSPANIEPWRHTARVSPDGGNVAFMSTAQPTGYNNVDINGGVPAAEVYIYDAEANGGDGSLHCVSCNPTGIRPAGREMEVYGGGEFTFWVAGQLPTWEAQLYARRALADSGARLFFESFEPLVLRDTNSKQDVYEWQRATSDQGCQEVGAELFVESAGGCISLISSGDGAEDSLFVDASPSGNDVFFATASSLLGQDDALVDIYDARVGGGFPAPAAPESPCEGEACQSPPAPPAPLTPASSTYSGPGNTTAKPKPRSKCRKGKRRVIRDGKEKCVRKARKGGRNGRAAR